MVDDRLMYSTDGVDYRVFFSLGYQQSLEMISQEGNVANIENEVKLILPIAKGRYKLRIETINSQYGNLYTEIDKIGDVADFDANEVEYLKRINIPRLQVEDILIEKDFKRDFILEPFEIKYLVFTKIM